MEMALGHLALLLVLKQLRFLVDIKSIMAKYVVTDKFIPDTLVVMTLLLLTIVFHQLHLLRFLLPIQIPLIAEL